MSKILVGDMIIKLFKLTSCKDTSSNTSRLEANAGFFHIAYEGDF
jgi:hypothetical protein